MAHFLPDPSTLALEAWHLDTPAATLTLQVTATAPHALCPLCQAPATRGHSRYRRVLADVPWGAYAVRVQLQVRKWFCDTPTCPRRIFTERLPTVVAPWARRTLRLAQRLLAYGLALGGEAGARLGGPPRPDDESRHPPAARADGICTCACCPPDHWRGCVGVATRTRLHRI